MTQNLDQNMKLRFVPFKPTKFLYALRCDKFVDEFAIYMCLKKRLVARKRLIRHYIPPKHLSLGKPGKLI